MRKTFKYRLYPTKNQVALLDRQLSLCCELYNAALQERRDAYLVCGRSIRFNTQSAQLPEIKRERSDLSDVYGQVLQDVLHRVDKSFNAFFRRAKQKQKAGYPRFRSQLRYNSFT